MAFFSKLHLSLRIRSESMIGGRLLGDTYKEVMAPAVESIRQSGDGVMSVDGATSDLAW